MEPKVFLDTAYAIALASQKDTKNVKLNSPILLQTPEISAFNGYLEALQCFLVGCNYVTRFEAKSFSLSDSHLPINEIMLLAYPNSKPNEAHIKKCSLEIMLEMTEQCFSYSEAAHTKTDFKDSITSNISKGFWRHLKHCVDYENAVIHSYNSELGLPGYSVFWGFAWLIHNRAQKRCVFVYGISSD